MSHTLFISDLHLCSDSPQTTRLFHHFIKQVAPQAEALYVLGDLFEYWAGDDDLGTAFHQEITAAFHTLTQQGTRLCLMHGNRDFLMGEMLADACGATLLTDPTLLEVYDQRILLTHGDTLCTDDIAYQQFRQQVRNNTWQQNFLAHPLATRKAQIAQLREHSKLEKKTKIDSIMDVNIQAVQTIFQEHDYPILIHGHTHRPAHHLYHIEGKTCERWVLADWDRRANALRCDDQGVRWEVIAEA